MNFPLARPIGLRILSTHGAIYLYYRRRGFTGKGLASAALGALLWA